jgi:DNA-binding FadR family transcriptional regulator
VDTHQAIVDAIEARQPSWARNLMALHFDEARNSLRVASQAGRHSRGIAGD